MLLDGLPEESRTKSSLIDGWTVHTELLAQLVEEVSLLASDRRREEPRTITRPYSRVTAATGGEAPEAQQPTKPMSGHQKMLAAAARRGMVRSG
ncbi:hypothetical protein GTY75_08690 [Streptomyces sp. SID8381]|uniref:hypothetical protein n=1 Tax=unclassified Streptomyces TaxID=2593676 RepID=UPI00037FC658|nr:MULTISPECIES: hypothetical protein [unclassified Streptomyces]MYX26745.1 hypothetical protein [Streptomyces sp. SID8381]